jgi:phosphoserine phosphatase RsbU/P
MFVTIFYGLLNTRTGEMQFSYGGQPPPYIKRSNGTIEQIEQQGGFLLGMVGGMEYDNHKVVLRPGDTILLYTDGVTEAMDGENQLFDYARLEASLARMNGAGLKEVLEGIHSDLAGFANGAPQADDITMLALQYRGKN